MENCIKKAGLAFIILNLTLSHLVFGDQRVVLNRVHEGDRPPLVNDEINKEFAALRERQEGWAKNNRSKRECHQFI